MQVLKLKAFSKWATKEGLSDKALQVAIEEIAGGLVDADLGGHVFKKRVAVGGRGKSGGVRTLLATGLATKPSLSMVLPRTPGPISATRNLEPSSYTPTLC